MSDLIVPDISEYQDDVDHAELAAHFPAIIIRAGYGLREDAKWRRNVAAVGAYRWWAAYWYIDKDVDSASQARKFLEVLGEEQPNATIGDLEEGDGDQSGREQAFLDVLTEQGARDFTYSGAWFTRAHNLQHVDWIAAYTNAEPSDAHLLWQFTSSYLFPGINGHVDASVFHGTIDDLLALTGSPTPAPAPEDPDEEDLFMALDPQKAAQLADAQIAAAEASREKDIAAAVRDLYDMARVGTDVDDKEACRQVANILKGDQSVYGVAVALAGE